MAGMAGMAYGDLLIGMVVGFGIVSVIMVIGFYLLMKTMNDLRTSITKIESRVEGMESKVNEVAKQLEEV